MDRQQIGKNIDEIRKARKMTVTDLARKVGVSYQMMHRNIKHGPSGINQILSYSEALGCDPADLLKESVDPKAYELGDNLTCIYPYNLIFAIFQDMDVLYDVYLPAFFDVFNELSIRERMVMEYRYKHLMELDAIGKEFSVTKERIRQINEGALHKLRRPVNVNRYLLGKKAFEKIESMKHTILLLQIENENLRKELSEVINYDELPDRPVEVPISTFNFSVRTYNCLTRAGIKTINDLSKKTIVDLMNMRNLGRKSLEEILAVANSHGITIEKGY